MKTTTKQRLAKTVFIALIGTIGGAGAYADDKLGGKTKGTKATPEVEGLVPVDVSLRFDGKRITRKLAKRIAKGKGPVVGFAACTKLDGHDCMSITVGDERDFTTYVVIDKTCELAPKSKSASSATGRTCLGGYGLASKARVTTTGWIRSSYETRDGLHRTKVTNESTTKLYLAGSGTKKAAKMKLFTTTDYRTEVLSSGQVNVSYSIYDGKGNVYEDQSLCPPDGTCSDQGYTMIASQSSDSIKDCDTQYGEGGTQDLIIDGFSAATVAIMTAGGTVSGGFAGLAIACAGVVTCPASPPAAGAGATIGGGIGTAIGIAGATYLQVIDKQDRDRELDSCRASYACDSGKATSEGIKGCTCPDDEQDPTDPDSCAAAKDAAEEISGSATGGSSKSGDGGDTPGGLACKADTDCPMGWRCDTQSHICIQY